MPKLCSNFDAMADMLQYPAQGYDQVLDNILVIEAALSADVISELKAFDQLLRPLSDTEREELFTHTFDINPVSSLEVGWQLFGEEYHRGTFLVRMREFMRRLGLEESAELPDHLMHVLQVAGRLEFEKGRDFVLACVLPAIKKMIKPFKDKANPYEKLLNAIKLFLENKFSKKLTGELI